jgi:hypothetical protein
MIFLRFNFKPAIIKKIPENLIFCLNFILFIYEEKQNNSLSALI